jgi:outer membrane protein assembly factor BamB
VGPEFNYKYLGSRGTPTIEDNRLYYAASMGDAVCLDAATGEMIWHVNIMEEFNGPAVKWGYTESPLIHKNKVFFTPGGHHQNFIALDKMDGSLIWSSDIDSTGNSYCSPVIIYHNSRDLILFNSIWAIVIVDPDNGNVLVRHPLTNSHINHALPPIYDRGRLFYSSGYGEGSTLFQMVEGKHTLDTIYTNKDLDAKISGMILYDGTVFGVSDQKKLWIGVDFESGATVFTSRDLKPGSFILADNKFYIYSEVGDVALAHPSRSGFEIVSSFHIPASTVRLAFAHPVIYNGTLYIRYEDRIWLYKI